MSKKDIKIAAKQTGETAQKISGDMIQVGNIEINTNGYQAGSALETMLGRAQKFKAQQAQNDNTPNGDNGGGGDKPDYQCKEYDTVKNKGPLPEGKWLVRQSQLQNFYKDQSKTDQAISKYGMGVFGKWRGGKDSWGNNRIWLEPAKGTDNKNRTNLSIHGGKEFGSSGCIDLTDKMDEFTNRFKTYGHDMILDVRYDEDCW